MAAQLKIEELVVGTGIEAKKGQTVSVHYTGWLTDGKKFDSSKDHGRPFSFALGRGQVIQGWDQGVAGMKVGGKRKLTIPPELGYGAQGFPGAIPANSTLVFEVELLGISQPSAQTAPQSDLASFWYYCSDAKAYFPYVRECSSGWVQVPQTAPPGQ